MEQETEQRQVESKLSINTPDGHWSLRSGEGAEQDTEFGG